MLCPPYEKLFWEEKHLPGSGNSGEQFSSIETPQVLNENNGNEGVWETAFQDVGYLGEN
jgi:hypothetical protein